MSTVDDMVKTRRRSTSSGARRQNGRFSKENVGICRTIVQKMMSDGDSDIYLMIRQTACKGLVFSLVKQFVFGHCTVIFNFRIINMDRLKSK